MICLKPIALTSIFFILFKRIESHTVNELCKFILKYGISLYKNEETKQKEKEKNYKIRTKKIQTISYADDAIIMAEHEEGLQRVIKQTANI